MKPKYSLADLTTFLASIMPIDSSSVHQLTEGHSSQVIGFTAQNSQQLVLRVRSKQKDLLADKYAYDHFGSTLPVPQVIKLGKMPGQDYYCVTEFCAGQTLYAFKGRDLQGMLPIVHEVFAKTFCMDITSTYGYGDVDTITGNGPTTSWKSSLENELDTLNITALQSHANSIGLDDEVVTQLVAQFYANLPYASETRRLLHGDPGYDNLLIRAGKVCAIIDWEQMAYGDWVRDFSRFEYNAIADYGNMHDFGTRFKLETKDLPQRKALYWAINALRDIEFAATQNNQHVASWLKQNIHSKLLKI